MNLFYTDTQKIYKLEGYNKNHATNGTMAYRKSYSNIHFYNDYVTKAEEISFLNNYENPMIQLNPLSSILVICHTDNTVNKNDLRNDLGKFQSKLKECVYKLEDLVRDKKIIDFYLSLKA